MPREKAKQWDQPLTVGALARYGGLDFSPPEGPFDPAGEWDLVWQIWLLKQYRRMPNHNGFIRLRRRKTPGSGQFTLEVEQRVINYDSVVVQKGSLICREDATSTPERWSLRFELLPFPDLKPATEVGLQKSGERSQLRLPVPDQPLSSSWSFLEALQRLSKSGGRELGPFTLLDELDKSKENQRVLFVGERTITVGGQDVKTRCYQRVGAGTLPWFTYLDAEGRLLVALSGYQALVANPRTLEEHRRVLEGKIRRRSRR